METCLGNKKKNTFSEFQFYQDKLNIRFYLSTSGNSAQGAEQEDRLSGGTERRNSDNYRKEVKTRPVGMCPNYFIGLGKCNRGLMYVQIARGSRLHGRVQVAQ